MECVQLKLENIKGSNLLSFVRANCRCADVTKSQNEVGERGASQYQ